MKTQLLAFATIISLFLAPLAVAQFKPLMIYGVSIGEERVAAVKFYDRNGERVLEQVQSEPLGARMSAITYLSRSKMLYMGAKDGSGFVYRVNEDGTIELVKKKKFKSGYFFLTPDRAGKFLLGASYESGNFDVYRLDENGLPAELTASRNEDKNRAHAVGISPDNKAVYLPFVKQNNSLHQYRFDPDTGKLEPYPKPTADVGEGAGPRHVVTHPNKPFLYFSNEQQLGISVYKVDDDGTLDFMGISGAPDTPPAKGLSGSDRTLTAFKIRDDGSLEKEATLKLGKDFWDILVLDVGAGL